MLTSVKKKLSNFLSQSSNDLTTNRDRKRPRDVGDDILEGSQQMTPVKRQRLHEEKENSVSVFQSFFSSALVQKMSDWVHNYTPGLFTWDPTKDVHQNQPATKSNGPGKSRNGGDSHHRFNTVDLTQDVMRGGEKNKSLSRRPLHLDSTRSQPAASFREGSDDGISGRTTLSTNCDSLFGARSKQSFNASKDGDLARRPTEPQSVASSRASSTDGRSERKKITNPFDRFFGTRSKQKFTAGKSICLEEKERYQQLLQQFTTIPLETTAPRSQGGFNRSCISVPKLPRFYFSSNQSILGSQPSQEVIPRDHTWEKEKSKSIIKVQPSHKKKSQPVKNGHVPDDDVVITDISVIQPVRKMRPLSSQTTSVVEIDDDNVIEVLPERPSRAKSPTNDYRECKFLKEDWIKNLTLTYNSNAREREREIAEEEIKAKLYDERRRMQEQDLEARIRQQMRIHAREPPVLEEVVEDEVEEEEEYIELTPEMERKIDQCFGTGNSEEILVDKFRLQIRRADIETLAGLNWLNDEVINFYMNLLMERGEKEGMPKVHAFNTFFYPKVVKEGQAAVRRWTRRVDVLAMDYLLVPVHLGMHWCLAVIDFKKKDIQYYDSMGGKNTQCLNVLRQYLCDESMDKKKKEFDLSGWKSTIVKDIPQQMNGSDCGMFACKYADYITREVPITFTQEHMPYFRRRMVYEIVTGQLLQ